LVKLRLDHKLAFVREIDVATRVRTVRDVLDALTRIVEQATAA
jgi:transcription-repair coupling factor (superfamily II helicase)